MSLGPRMSKPVYNFIDECLRIELKSKSPRSADKIAEDVMGTIKVYMLLNLKKPVVSDNNLQIHLVKGLKERGLKAKVSNTQKIKGLKLEHLFFTEKGAAYLNLYKREVLGQGLSWTDFSVRVLSDRLYAATLENSIVNPGILSIPSQSIVEAPQTVAASPIVSEPTPVNTDPLGALNQSAIKVYEGITVGEIKDYVKKSIEDLRVLSGILENKSNAMISIHKLSSQDADDLADFMLHTHRKHFVGAATNETELKKVVKRTEDSFMDVLTVLGLIEGQYKDKKEK